MDDSRQPRQSQQPWLPCGQRDARPFPGAGPFLPAPASAWLASEDLVFPYLVSCWRLSLLVDTAGRTDFTVSSYIAWMVLEPSPEGGPITQATITISASLGLSGFQTACRRLAALGHDFILDSLSFG